MRITGATRLVGLLGWPVTQSKSPVFQNAAFAAAGLDWCYVPLGTPPGQLPAAVRGLAAMGFVGANVTIPHKEAVLGLLDAIDDEAALAGSANTLVVEGSREHPRLVGYTTDGPGFLASLREETGADAAGMTVLLLGAGGAARSLAAAFVRAGADRVIVANRTVERAEALVAALAGRAARTRLAALPLDAAALAPHLGSVDLVVQATSLGMTGGGAPTAMPPLDMDRLRPSTIAADLVYAPPRTPFLAAAEARGLTRFGGAGMLLHQGALAFERWTGRTAPLDVMRRALADALGSPVGPRDAQG
ncbi:MAG TPA: shikimate dehydrogenase [Thermodesulfobacteriota bacterium]